MLQASSHLNPCQRHLVRFQLRVAPEKEQASKRSWAEGAPTAAGQFCKQTGLICSISGLKFVFSNDFLSLGVVANNTTTPDWVKGGSGLLLERATTPLQASPALEAVSGVRSSDSKAHLHIGDSVELRGIREESTLDESPSRVLKRVG